jgi:TRAP transporter 4TM/12TM fusion protein
MSGDPSIQKAAPGAEAGETDAARDDDRELGERKVAVRPLGPGMERFVYWFSIAVALLHLFMNGLGSLLIDATLWLAGLLGLAGPTLRDWMGDLRQLAVPATLLKNALHFASFGLLAAIFYPTIARPRFARSRAGLAFDICLGVVGGAAGLFLIFQEMAIYDRGVRLLWPEWVAGIALIVVALELARRTTGWIIPILSVVALSYATWLGPEVPGILRFAGLSAETVLFRTIFNDQAIFGTIAGISSGIVVMFILFGAFLLKSGAAQAIVDLSRVVAGRLVGGPGLVAVFASALTGTISGSAVANTAQTGTITIPLMQRSGYPGRFAAGVEASASTGGQLMPPIMGAGAFIMANYTQIPYVDIIAVAALPALLYFLSVGFYVRIEAKRVGLEPEPDHGLDVREVLIRATLKLLMPIGALIWLLIEGFTPTYCAGIATVAVVVGSWFTKERMGLREIGDALVTGVRNVTMIAVLLVSIGIFVNIIPTTALGNTLSLMIAEWADGSLLIAFVLVALASLILGMGLPVTAAYVVLAVLSAPALRDLIVYNELIGMLVAGTLPEAARISFMLVDPEAMSKLAEPMTTAAAEAFLAAAPPEIMQTVRDQAMSAEAMTLALLSAHMIIFWLSQDSNVTPPVCLTAFTAAAIAKTDPMKTGFESWKIAKGLYFVPLLFAYTPFLGGPIEEVLEIFVFAAIGLYAVAAAFQGHLEGPLSWPERALMLTAGALLFWPQVWWTHGAGLAIFALVFAWNWRQSRRVLASRGKLQGG